MKTIRAVDLFCGAGGLTYGLQKAGVNVIAGVDIDPQCKYPYSANNKAKFILRSVKDLKASEVKRFYAEDSISVLAGCAPCQPFSTYSQGPKSRGDDQWRLLSEFQRLIDDTEPDIVTMENVPKLAKHEIFDQFVACLKENGYSVFKQVVDCRLYGLPQMRKRLVLIASKLGDIKLIEPTRKPTEFATVRDVIANLTPLKAGEYDPRDRLHVASELSETNLKRIKQSEPGGTWHDWEASLVAKCHKKKSGNTYASVYGRMTWDDPAPTMTTQFFGFGNGRFGHPKQNRAISLREGAMFQGFPKKYKFVEPRKPVHMKSIGRLIGNAVPVRLGEVIGRSIVKHVKEFS